MKPDTPNPGSPEAIKQGCTCPVKDNRMGEGFTWGGLCGKFFYMTEGCPIHDINSLEST